MRKNSPSVPFCELLPGFCICGEECAEHDKVDGSVGRVFFTPVPKVKCGLQGHVWGVGGAVVTPKEHGPVAVQHERRFQ